MADYPPTPPSSPPASPAAGPPPPSYPPYAPPPTRPRRLVRSSRERLWAGVAGGMAEYFEIDPALVRLLWVAAAVVTGGLAIPAYILLWIILPRDDRPPVGGSNAWRGWSEEFHSETARLAEEARRAAESVSSRHPEGTPQASPEQRADEPWWWSERYIDRPRGHHRHPRSTGVVLVALGVLLLAANAGVFTWIEWRTMWPLIFIGLGVILLARQSGWGR